MIIIIALFAWYLLCIILCRYVDRRISKQLKKSGYSDMPKDTGISQFIWFVPLINFCFLIANMIFYFGDLFNGGKRPKIFEKFFNDDIWTN